MALAAIDDLEDALTATRQFLLPVDVRQWVRLAVIAFFVGGAGSAGAGSGSSGSGGGDVSIGDIGSLDLGMPTDTVIAAALAVGAVLLVLGLAFAVLSAIMEFVLVESLRRETVHLRQFIQEYWRAGLRLFAFRLVVGLVMAGVVVAVVLSVLAMVGIVGPGDPGPVRAVVGVLVGLPVLVFLVVGGAVGLGLTREFVVPVMVLEGTTVLGGWRRFWPTLRHEWDEYLVFVVVAVVLRLVASLVVGFAVGIAAAILLVPLGLVAALGFFVTGGSIGPLVLVGLGGFVLAAVVVLLGVAAIVQVPVVTFFRYYSLLVLGDTEAVFDVIEARRQSIRADEPAG